MITLIVMRVMGLSRAGAFPTTGARSDEIFASVAGTAHPMHSLTRRDVGLLFGTAGQSIFCIHTGFIKKKICMSDPCCSR